MVKTDSLPSGIEYLSADPTDRPIIEFASSLNRNMYVVYLLVLFFYVLFFHVMSCTCSVFSFCFVSSLFFLLGVYFKIMLYHFLTDPVLKISPKGFLF